MNLVGVAAGHLSNGAGEPAKTPADHGLLTTNSEIFLFEKQIIVDIFLKLRKIYL